MKPTLNNKFTAMEIFSRHFGNAFECTGIVDVSEFAIPEIKDFIFIRFYNNLKSGIRVINNLYLTDENVIDTASLSILTYRHFKYNELKKFDEYLKNLAEKIRKLRLEQKKRDVKKQLKNMAKDFD